MKRRLVALLVALMTMVGTAFAAEENTIDPSVSQLRWSTAVPYASAYLDDYSIAFGARDNCRMVITMDVNAVRVMDRIGLVPITLNFICIIPPAISTALITTVSPVFNIALPWLPMPEIVRVPTLAKSPPTW